jgi:hypothetical protein
MGWERRRNTVGLYFTVTVRRGGGRRRIYFGTDEMGELAATHLEIKHLERQQRRDVFEEDLRSWRVMESAFQRYWRGTELLTSACLVAGGYHQHCGEWRRKRHGRKAEEQ